MFTCWKAGEMNVLPDFIFPGDAITFTTTRSKNGSTSAIIYATACFACRTFFLPPLQKLIELRFLGFFFLESAIIRIKSDLCTALKQASPDKICHPG